MALSIIFLAGIMVAPNNKSSESSRITPIVKVVKQISPAVVSIYSSRKRKFNPFNPRSSHSNLPFPARKSLPVLGSGILISAKGYIVTNEHIVTKAFKLKVKLQNGKVYKPKVVGTNKKLDIALLKIKGKTKFPYAKLGNSDKIMIGETVIAIGNPYGLSSSASRGIVSALHRNLVINKRLYPNVIQTDTAINPGNSGGPLLNIKGEVIGINSFIHKTANNIGFAIPSSQTKRIVNELTNFGKTRAVYLGISVTNKNNKVHISKVFKNSPFDKAKIKSGTALLKLKNYKITDIQSFTRALSTLVVGEKIKVKTSKETKRVKVSALKPKKALSIFTTYLGIKITDTKGSGAQIKSLKRKAYGRSLGLKQGDIIIRVNRKKLKNIKQLSKYLAFIRPGNSIYTVILRRGNKYPLTIPY
ncbi:MAG: trypsin-like peptidase domain-containing protein [Myxococcota bacterium]